MWAKDLLLCLWSILVISLPRVSSSEWKPIVPPAEYYMTKPTTCIADCDVNYKYPHLEDAGEGEPAAASSETQLKSTLLNQPLTFNPGKDFHHQQSNQKLDLEVFKPAEISFFPKENVKTFNSPISTFEEIRKTPTSFFSFKTFATPQKPTKTIYYGDLELGKPNFSDDLKYFNTFKQTLGNEAAKVLKTPNFIDNEVNALRPLKNNHFDEHCPLYKVSFRQDLYYQYLQYKVHMPELKEFTLCLWTKFHNHSHDHSLFSYAAKHHRKAIYMWVSNLNEPALFNMKIMGQTIFRLNYPIKLYKWYHTCQSWNGKTGEWQVWVNSHRIGRGFHNLLVGHPIPGGGVAITGQEQRHFGKGFQEIPHYLKGSGGLEGEITMLQLYKVALTAGKAYNDHRHHHSHYTSTTPEPPELPTEEPSTTTDHPFLENGQLKKHINVLELAEALRHKGNLDLLDHHDHHDHHEHHEHHDHHDHHHPGFDYFNAHLPHAHVGHLVPLALQGNAINFLSLPNHAIFKRNDGNEVKTPNDQSGKQEEDQGAEEQKENPEKVKFISTGHVRVEKVKFSAEKDANDSVAVALPLQSEQEVESRADNSTTEEYEENFTEPYDSEEEQITTRTGFREGRARLKRHNTRSSIRVITNRPKRIAIGELKPSRYSMYRLKKRGDVTKTITSKEFENKEKGASKRHILYGDPYLNFGSLGLTEHDIHSPYSGVAPASGFSYDHLSHFGHDEDDEHVDDNPLHEPAHDDYDVPQPELAEGEVRRVMALCSGCHSDPFRKVAVISWRSTPKKIYSGALFLKAKPECEHF